MSSDLEKSPTEISEIDSLSTTSSNINKLDCALDLMRRLSPSKIDENLNTLIELMPAYKEDLLSLIDRPLKIHYDEKASSKEFLICDYNRVGDSYRSPWTNSYWPELEDNTQHLAVYPSSDLRKLEVMANDAFAIYTNLYYDNGLSSVYLWDINSTTLTDDPKEIGNFGAAVLIKKLLKEDDPVRGNWDSIHILEINHMEKSSEAYKKKEEKVVLYKLTSTVMLNILTNSEMIDELNLSGNITRQVTQEFVIKDKKLDYIAHMGRMIEEQEGRMRSSLSEIYFNKTKDLLNQIKSTTSKTQLRMQKELQKMVLEKMNKCSIAQIKTHTLPIAKDVSCSSPQTAAEKGEIGKYAESNANELCLSESTSSLLTTENSDVQA